MGQRGVSICEGARPGPSSTRGTCSANAAPRCSNRPAERSPAKTARKEVQQPHQRTRAAPQVNPPPMASRRTRSPRLIRPSRTASPAPGAPRPPRCCRAVDRGDHLLERDAELARRPVEDALIGLVRHKPVDVGAVVPAALMASSIASVMSPPRDGRPPCPACAACRWSGSRTVRHRHRACIVPPVREKLCVENTAVGDRALAPLQHHGASAVAEQHAGGAVVPVQRCARMFPRRSPAPCWPGRARRMSAAPAHR